MRHLTSRHHITSHHLPHLTSPHLASTHLTSPQLTSPHLSSHVHPTSPCVTSRHFMSLMSPHAISPHLTSPHLTSPHLTSDQCHCSEQPNIHNSTGQTDATHSLCVDNYSLLSRSFLIVFICKTRCHVNLSSKSDCHNMKINGFSFVLCIEAPCCV